MKLKNDLKYLAAPLKIGITLLMLLLAICFLQAIIYQTGFLLTRMADSRESTEPEDPNRRIPRADKNFLPDGSIHIVQKLGTSPRRGEYRQERIYDANDNLLWEGPGKDRPYKYLSWAESFGSFFTQRRIRDMQTISLEFSRTIEIPVSSQERTEEVWRYEVKSNIFVGYELGGDIIGYIGSEGFAESRNRAGAFEHFNILKSWVPQDSFSPVVLCRTNRVVYEINFEKQKVEVIFESPESDIEQLRFTHWPPLPEDEPFTSQPISSQIISRPLIYCRSADEKHHLIIRDPQQKVTFSVPDEWRADSVKVTATDENIFLLYRGNELEPPKGVSRSSLAWQKWSREFIARPMKCWVELYKVADNGSLELVNHFEWTKPARSIDWDKMESGQRIKAGVVKISPAAYDLVWYLFGDKLEHHARQGSGISRGFAEIIREFRPGGSVMNIAISFLMMALALWHGWARRTCWGKMTFWVILAGAFNVAGLLTYLALNHTAVIKCPACGKSRGLEQNLCVRCGADLPGPKPWAVDLLLSKT